MVVAFRRDGQSARSWSLWIDRHRDALERSGVPDFVYTDKRHWVFLLEHNGWDADTGWRVEMLAPQQAAQLHEFIVREYGRDEYRGLLRALEAVSGQV
jgi:hypothetical protein